MKFFVRTPFVVFLWTTIIWAQSTSQISGTVHDPTGASVPSATVKVIQTETGLTRTSLTSPDGAYLLPNLPVGSYRMEVTREGFSTFVEPGIILEVNTNPAINPTLKVGAVSEQVTVEAEALSVETHSTGVGQVINHEEVVDLPLNAREPTQLILLVGNATTQGVVNSDLNTNKNFPTITISVAGGNANTISFSLDGATANEPFNGLNQPLPFPDALQEFKVETSSVGAQNGQHAAAAVSVVTRSGTNSLHGNVFEYVRNYEFNGRSATALVRDSLKQNQFGGTIGGAFIKNKLFYFGGEESTIKRSNPGDSTGNSMTPAMLSGDFTVIASTQCQAKAITLSDAAGDWVGNKIAPSRMDPIAMKIATFLPASGQQNGCGLFNYQTGANQRQYQVPVKVDYIISPKQSAFVRYQLSNNLTPVIFDPADPLFTEGSTGQSNNIQSTVVGDSYTINPNFVSSTHIQANRSLNPRFVPNFRTPASLGIPITPFVPDTMNMTVTGGFNLGQNPGYFNTLTYSGAEDLTLIRGKHQLQFGAQYIRAYMHAQNVRGVNGNLNFTGQYSNAAGTTGLGYSDFVTGQLNNFGQGRPFYDDDKSDYYGLYVQDAWRLASRLTLNLGVRFEPYLPQRNTDNYVESFSLSNFIAGTIDTPPTSTPSLTTACAGVATNPCPPAGLVFSANPGAPPNQQYTFGANHWLPRVGIVWDPFGDGKTSIRASYGLLFDNPHMFFFTRVSNNPPWGATLSRTGEFPLSNPWQGYPGGDPFLTSSTTGKSFGFFPLAGVYVYADPHLKANEVNTWNLAIQRQLGKWLLSGSYIGNHSAHLWNGTDMNPIVYIPGTCTSGQYGLTAAGPCSSTAGANQTARRQLQLLNPKWAPYYGGSMAVVSSSSNSSYNAMLMSAQHRLSNNFSVLGNWTWSHTICDPSTVEITGPSFEQPFNPGADRSNCSSDHRHQVNISGVVTSPRVNDRMLGLVANGWQLSPIYHWGSGNLATVTYGADVALTGSTANRAQQILPDIYGSGGPLNYLNPAAFLTSAQAPLGLYAPTRPNTVVNPNVWNLDLSLSRNFRIRERGTLTFRAEAFNMTNSVVFGGVTTGLTSASFGRLTPQAQSTAPGNNTTARVMQFALKYAF